MKKILSNQEIVFYTEELVNNFNDNSLTLPLKVNFAIQKNLKVLSDNAEIINKLKENLGEKNGIFNEEDSSYKIDEEKIPFVRKELKKLAEIEQSIDIYMIKLEDLDNLELNSKQMQSLLFMIDE